MSRKEFSIANQVLQENTNIAISALDSVLQEYEQIYKVKQNTETKNNHSSKDATSKLENILINAKKPIYVKETNQLPIIEVKYNFFFFFLLSNIYLFLGQWYQRLLD